MNWLIATLVCIGMVELDRDGSRRRPFLIPLMALAVAHLAFTAGCVQVTIANDRARVERMHQDVARTTSSTQSTDLSADVPVSLVPK